MQRELGRRQFVTGVSASLVTAGLAGCLGDDEEVPEVSFGFDSGSDAVTITHDGGERLDEDNTGAIQILRTEGDSETFLSDWELPVTEGDSTTVEGRFQSGQTVVIRWVTPDEEELADLATVDIE